MQHPCNVHPSKFCSPPSRNVVLPVANMVQRQPATLPRPMQTWCSLSPVLTSPRMCVMGKTGRGDKTSLAWPHLLPTQPMQIWLNLLPMLTRLKNVDSSLCLEEKHSRETGCLQPKPVLPPAPTPSNPAHMLQL